MLIRILSYVNVKSRVVVNGSTGLTCDHLPKARGQANTSPLSEKSVTYYVGWRLDFKNKL